jgi:hypothetical protein
MDKKLLEKLRRVRKYASFFEWPDKKLKERGVVADLLHSMQLEGVAEYGEPSPALDDPPDCIVSDRDGIPVAVEVTELVSAEAIRRNQRGDNVYRDWKPHEVIDEINNLLLKKDGKRFHNGPYAKKIVLIFTDEIILQIRQDEYAEYLAERLFGSVEQIDEAYLLFSYDGIDRCPYIKLRLDRLQRFALGWREKEGRPE